MSGFKEYESDAAVVADLASQDHILNTTAITGNVLLVHPEAKTLDVENFDAGRSRKRGTFTTSDINSFTNYVTTNAEPDEVRIFVDERQMNAQAVLNFVVSGYEQGHLDHNAILIAKKTVTFKTLRDMHMQGRCQQKVFAEFLEDWGHRVVAKDSNGDVISNDKAVNAIRNMRIDETASTDSQSGNYRESRSRLESVEAKSIEGALPASFTVTDECCHGIPARTLNLRLGISQDGGKPLFKLEIIGLQILEDELAKDFAAIVAGEFDDACDVLIGSFSG